MVSGTPAFLQFGPVQFQVWPLNYHEMDHQTGSSYARKEVMDAIPQREHTGEDDEEYTIRGRIFPFRTGGVAELVALDTIRQQGSAHLLVRGSNLAQVLGWYVIERLSRRHRFISIEGYGRMVEFEALFSRVDTPAPEGYISDIMSAMSNVG